MVIGIILAYLFRTKNSSYAHAVYAGTSAAVIASIIAAVLFNTFSSGLHGRAEEIFEGVTMFVAAFLLSFMIVWMFKQRRMLKRHVEEQVSKAVERERKVELFLLSFVAVFREGVETTIFLAAVGFLTNQSVLVGSILGIASAVFLSYLLFVASKRINLRLFFNITSFLLVLFAAGLVAHGVHELQEARLITVLGHKAWDIGWLVSEQSFFGSLLKSLFGYNADPSLVEILAYFAYLALIFRVLVQINKSESAAAAKAL